MLQKQNFADPADGYYWRMQPKSRVAVAVRNSLVKQKSKVVGLVVLVENVLNGKVKHVFFLTHAFDIFYSAHVPNVAKRSI